MQSCWRVLTPRPSTSAAVTGPSGLGVVLVWGLACRRLVFGEGMGSGSDIVVFFVVLSGDSLTCRCIESLLLSVSEAMLLSLSVPAPVGSLARPGKFVSAAMLQSLGLGKRCKASRGYADAECQCRLAIHFCPSDKIVLLWANLIERMGGGPPWDVAAEAVCKCSSREVFVACVDSGPWCMSGRSIACTSHSSLSMITQPGDVCVCAATIEIVCSRRMRTHTAWSALWPRGVVGRRAAIEHTAGMNCVASSWFGTPQALVRAVARRGVMCCRVAPWCGCPCFCSPN